MQISLECLLMLRTGAEEVLKILEVSRRGTAPKQSSDMIGFVFQWIW